MNRTGRKNFIGSWQLNSWIISYPASERLTHPFGSSPTGLIVYSETGWMSAAICRSDRALFNPSQNLRSMPATVLAQAYKSYFHYAGPYRVEDGQLIHSVRMSLNPDFVGTEQVRDFTFDGDLLILRGTERFDDSPDTELRTHRLQWQRIKAA
ncbi:MAG: lipocalin-like domain-containing protein [Gammaproteobacteria bacterium]|nr:lipocalin-like domain-containing protein [Gammaproteobacteria bacterium]